MADSQVNGANSVDTLDGKVEDNRLSEIDYLKDKFTNAFKSLGTLRAASNAPLPTGTGDGSYLPQAERHGLLPDAKEIFADIAHLGITDYKTLMQVFEDAKLGKLVDDKTYLMEHIIQVAAKLPEHNIGTTGVTNNFVATLWNDLEHPPQIYLGKDYTFRKPDGSFNSFLNDKLGAAYQPYARTVKPSTVQPSSLPDPGVIFDSVMARKKPELHPSRISSMLFYLASIIIHDLFRTDHNDFNISKTSSYLDLSPLYGSDWPEQQRMRTFKDGKIKPDCFSETRLLSFPPGVGALLIMFNRFHNYIVEQLPLVNEADRFTKPAEDDAKEKWDKYDDDLFQTGRLVTCGLYVNIILLDYVRTILDLNKTDSNWQLNPRVETQSGLPMGTGNQVSAEFNLVYRWHAATSDRDDKWTQKLFADMFQGRKPTEIPQKELLKTLGHLEHEMQQLDPLERPFANLKRNSANHKFKDDDLVELLVSSIEDCANAMGPQQVPMVMKAIEVLGMQQARSWNLATLNEFRKHFKLKPHETFESITDNKEVAEALKHLYDTPDNVELYPGLVVEDHKDEMTPGSGLCPSYTVSRAVLSDAVALVRGDRFYTTSFHPKALTSWGYAEQGSDLTIDNGCVFYKLFLRAFPNNFEPESVYVHYPLTVPEEMTRVLKKLRKAHLYSFKRPGNLVIPKLITSYATAAQVIDNHDVFKVTWGKAMEFLMGPRAMTFMLSGDEPANFKSRKLMEQSLYLNGSSRAIPKGNEKWLQEVRAFYEKKTLELLKQKQYKLAGTNYVDLMRDVVNPAQVHFCAEVFSLPLKTEKTPHGIFDEQKFYLMMAAVFTCIFFDVDPPHSFPLRLKAREATQLLGKLLEAEVTVFKTTGSFTKSFLKMLKVEDTDSTLKSYGFHMIE
ncbi:hypothetical protein LTR66_013990, partial [Elasticomyces elasticus]